MIQQDLAWNLIRLNATKLFDISITSFESDNQSVPAWSGFNVKVYPDSQQKTTVGYCPMLDASPTEFSTVYTVMKTVQNMMISLQQTDSVMTFDLAIYVKAKEIQLRLPNEFSNTVIRMGGFHIALNYLSLLGKKYKDSGIEDLLIESEVYGGSTAASLLSGKSYNRGVRAHKLTMEAMFRLEWQSFMCHLESNRNQLIDTKTIQSNVLKCQAAIEASTEIGQVFDELLVNLTELTKEFESFRNNARKKSPTFTFWDDYINMVRLLLQFIKAERIGNWSLHLEATAKMAPHFFAMDRMNYSRWLPVYLSDMHQLPQQHPLVHKEFMEGNHSISRSSQPFAQVWTDMALEQSINLDSKSKGGIIGITQRPEALARWFLTSHERAAITTALKDMCGLQDSEYIGTHKEAAHNRMRRDEEDVQKLTNCFTSGLMTDPFFLSPDEADQIPLINFASGVVVPSDVTQRLLRSHELGKASLNEFIHQRLDTNELKFWDPIPQLKVKTFTTMTQQKKLKTADEKLVTVTADRDLFGRLLVVANARDINVKEVLSFELSSIPFALSYPDGTLRKTNKSTLLAELEKNCTVSAGLANQDVQYSTGYILDGMALVQTLKNCGVSNFGQLAELHYNAITSYFNVSGCNRVDIIFDQYIENSIKSTERLKRGASSALEVKIYGKNTPIPKQWQKYISNSKNKVNLCAFLSKMFVEFGQTRLQPNQKLVIAGGFEDGQESVMVTRNNYTSLEVLASDHEEADTRIILHAHHASSENERIVIQSPDTDVATLCISHFSNIGCRELWFKTGVKDKRRFIPIHDIYRDLGADLCNALLALHAITGCDSTSALSGIGKKKAWKFLISNTDFQEILSKFGETAELDREHLLSFESFICRLYCPLARSGNTTDGVRYWLFCQRRQKSESLPPTSDSLLHHLERANYQTYIWKSSLLAKQQLPTPKDHGWDIDSTGIHPILMTKDPAPTGVIELTICHCKSGCRRASCSCSSNGLSCTEACNCMAADEVCFNPNTLLFNESDDDDSD